MFFRKTLLLMSLLLTFLFSKGEVSKVFAHKEKATSSSYSLNGIEYKWGLGDNIIIDGFEYDGERYNYATESTVIKIRRSDNNNSAGEPCGIFAEKQDNNISDNYNLTPTFPQDCDMAKIMGGRIINIGALDLFKNSNDTYDTPKNIERVDFISPNGITAPLKTENLAKAGHIVTEASGNNEIKIAVILSLDSNGDPASYGPLVTVHDENGDASRKVEYGDTYTYLDDGTLLGTRALGFYRNEKFPPQTSLVEYIGGYSEKLDMAFVSLEDLGVNAGQTYYGFSYFPSDVYDTMNLVDYQNFPKDTPVSTLNHTDTADPYGGVAGYFVNEDMLLSISGSVFEDTNHNGIQDSDEPNLASDTYIKICSADNSFIKSIKVDHTIGKYTIDDVKVGQYKIIEDASNTQDCNTSTNISGYISTTQDIINIDLNSSDVLNANFGNYRGSTVSGYVYNDTNQNGHKDSNEVGIPNVKLEIKKCASISFGTAVTDENGKYTFWVPIDDYNERWVGIWETDLADYNSTEDEIDNGEGLQTEYYDADNDPNWLCFGNRLEINFEEGGLELVGNNFGDFKIEPAVPFSCSSDTYLFNGYPSSDAYTINLTTGEYILKKSAINNRINATGYNTKDNLIWGYDIDKHVVIRIDSNYDIVEYKVDNLPDESYYAGDVSDGILYLHANNSDKLYKVNLNDSIPQYDGFITLNKSGAYGDFAFNPINNLLYTIDTNDKTLYKIDITTGSVTSIKSIDIDDNMDFHTFIFDGDGNLYFYGTSGKIYKIYIGDESSNTYNVELFTTTAILKADGDGARCSEAQMPTNTDNGICYGLIDNGKKVYEMDLTSDDLSKTMNIDKEFVGEGTAYRSSNHTLYAFQTYTSSGDVDRHGDTSTLYSIDLNSQEGTINVVKLKDDIVANEVEGAEFYYDPETQKEILYVLTSIDEEKDTIKLHAFYADNWDNEIEGYPKSVNGVSIDSLAIDPQTGQGYATDDAEDNTPPKVYKLDLKTGVATFLFQTKIDFDAEGLAFARDGNLYTEDEGYHSGLARNIYKIDLDKQEFTLTRTLSGTTDIEGLSCNGIALGMESSSIELSISNVKKPEGSSGTTSFDFVVSLSKPAPAGGLNIEFKTEDGTAKDEDFSDDNESIFPKISISDATATEGTDSTIKFDILLDKPAPVGGVTVQVNPQSDSGSTAIENSDYTSTTNSIFIAEGEFKKEIEYLIVDDTEAEDRESFNVELSSPTNAILDKSIGVGTIYDNDGDQTEDTDSTDDSSSWWDIISSWMSKVIGDETEKSSSQSVQKNINYNKNTQITIQKDEEDIIEEETTEETEPTTTTTIIPDYQKIQGTLTINEGETNGTIHVLVNGDDEVEGDETFYVITLPPEGINSIMPIGIGTIVDDDNSTPTSTQGMLLTRGDNNDDTKTNVYLFDINLSNNEVSNFHIVSKLDKKFRSLDYHDEKYITSDMEGNIYYIDPITGEAILDSNYNKIDNSNIYALDFDTNGDIIYEINNTNLYRYNSSTSISSIIKTFSENLNGAISFYNSDYYSSSFISGGIKNINSDIIEDVVESHNQLEIFGGDRISSTKSYFINSQLNDLNMYLYESGEWSSFYNYGSGTNGNTAGLIGEAIAIKSLSENSSSSPEPFGCTQEIFFSNRTQSGSAGSDSGETWLHIIDQNSTPYSFKYIDNGFVSSNGGYNALAYNPKDNFMYALYQTHLLKIDKNANIIDLGIVEGLTTQLYAGAFDREGNYFVSGDSDSNDKLYKIDINQTKVTDTLSLSIDNQEVSVKFMDMTIDKSDQYLYTMLLDNNNSNDKFVKIDKNSGEITIIKDKPTGLSSFVELIFSDVDGDMFLVEHNNGFYKIDTENGYLYKLSDTEELADYSDGTNCVEANISEPSTISIEKTISKFEGDSGETIFTFGISFSKPAPADASFDVSYLEGEDAQEPREKAQDQSDFDKKATTTISIPQGTTHYDINVTVYGDLEIEADEEFYIELSNPKNLAINNARGVGVILNDDHANFNIERVDSDNITPTTEDEQKRKEALYTQIAQKDFNYCIVSYDKNSSNFQEYPVENITLKIELIDANSSAPDNILYTTYKYLDNKSSRFDIIDNNDLKIRATREAIYKISYLEQNNSIVQGDFTGNTDVFENNDSLKSFYSRDSFAIRPAGFKLMLSADDGTNRKLLETNNQNNTYGVALASGYNYELEVSAINDIGETETSYNTSYISSLSSQEVNATLLFDSNKTTCDDIADKNLKYYDFTQGVNINKDFSRDNVGNFIAKVIDANWTNIDHFEDCVPNSSSNIADSSGKFGCNIGTTFEINSPDSAYNSYYDMKVYFQPYSFDVNLSVNSSVSNTHSDFLYMGDLTQSNDMAILINGYIKAKEKNGKTATNFTKNCFAHNVNLFIDYTATTDKGTFDNPTSNTVVVSTTKNSIQNPNGETIFFQKREKHNDNDYTDVSKDTVLENNITLSMDDFLDTNKGTSYISLLYNVEKSIDSTINPIKLDFHKASVISKDSQSTTASSETDEFFPEGEGTLDSSKILYYGAIIPDKENYPDSYSRSASTPVGVYIYCLYDRSFCNDMIGDNGLNSFKTQMGWYISVKHDSNSDGTINPTSEDEVSITPDPIPNFNEGAKGRLELQTNYIGGIIPVQTPIRTEISINPSPWLQYHPLPNRHGNPFWRVKFRSDQKGTMTGVGSAGHIIQINANRAKTNKMDW